jgi:hypothetical protein
MLNVLSNGKQHDITTTLMVKVQLFCGVASSVFTIAKSFAVCRVVGYVSVEGKNNLALHNVIFCLLDLMIILQVYQLFGL